MNWKRSIGWLLSGCLVLGLSTGCVFWDSTRRTSERTSLLGFLYPKGSEQKMTPTIPTLKLPLRVGLTWVPLAGDESHRHADSALPAQFLEETLGKVRNQFTNLPFVSEVVIVPGQYLEAGGGFDNLDQVRTMLGIDVIALVSRDQKQFTDPNALSFLYLTVVGAFAVPAEKNETYTMVDTAVFDIPSRTLLFRAPGIHRSKGHSTYVGIDAALRSDQQEGLNLATDGMVKNLKTELTGFQERIKKQPESVHVVHSPGYTGGGAGGWMDLAWVGGVVMLAWGAAGLRRQGNSSEAIEPMRRSSIR